MAQLTYASIDQTVLDTLKPPGRSYWLLVALVFAGLLGGVACWVCSASVMRDMTISTQPPK